MKKGYLRLLIFEFILFIILFLNSFVWNILNGYITILFLLIILVIFKVTFGFEKDRHRYMKDVLFDITILLLASFLIYYLFGIIIGFYKVNNYYTLYGLKAFIVPIMLIVICKEFLRYQIFTKSEGSPLLILLTTILFIFLDISSAIYYGNFTSAYKIFLFIALTVLPSISSNISCTYISSKIGYKPNILWLMVTELYIYLIPIIPNPNEYILSIIKFIFPLVVAYVVYLFFDKVNDKEVSRDYNKKNILYFIMPSIIVMIMVYFTCGYFKYTALAIASGSMRPNINKGDVVIYEKIDDYSLLDVGDIIAYKYGNVVVVHRIVNIVEDNNEYYFYTKGDNNNDMDNYIIYENMIKGIVQYKIPYIGLPTVWLNGL